MLKRVPRCPSGENSMVAVPYSPCRCGRTGGHARVSVSRGAVFVASIRSRMSDVRLREVDKRLLACVGAIEAALPH
jgi:hypothetical protein